MNVFPIYTRLLGAAGTISFIVYIILSAWNPQTMTPPEGELVFRSATTISKVDHGAIKLGDKLNCAKKTYTLRKKTWTWSCMNKSKTRGYSLVHPDFAFDLLTDDTCAPSRQVWFTMPGNGWAIGAKSRSALATKQLASEVQKQTGGFTFYACR